MRALIAGCTLALALPVFAAGCGGDDDDGGSGEDPAELLRTALGQDTEFDSGVLNIGLNGSLEGTTSGSIDASVSGPFQSGGEGQPPELSLDATANVSAEGIPNLPGGSVSFDFDGGFALADDSLFVTYNDTTYEAGDALYSQISPLLESASTVSDTSSNPQDTDAFIDALTNLENEGTEDVEGESVQHVSGDLDFAKLAEDANGAAVPFDTSQLEGFDATVDVFVAEEDDTFRRFDIGLSAADVEALQSSGVDGFDVTLSIGISSPNEEQTIDAPTDTQPLNNLLKQFGLTEELLAQQIQQGLSGLVVPGAGLPGGSGVPGGAATDPQVQDCIASATNADEITGCLQ
jgi:hypothetical protein